jgi:hypothetical protein
MSRARALLLALVLATGGGWFAISWLVMGAAPGDAANEATGAALGMLVFVALIGAIRQGRRSSGE